MVRLAFDEPRIVSALPPDVDADVADMNFDAAEQEQREHRQDYGHGNWPLDRDSDENMPNVECNALGEGRQAAVGDADKVGRLPTWDRPVGVSEWGNGRLWGHGATCSLKNPSLPKA